MPANTNDNTSIERLKAGDWLQLPLTCFLLGIIAGALVTTVLVIIFIC